MKISVTVILLLLSTPGSTLAQFVETFNDNSLKEWEWYTGDGKATIDMTPDSDHATIRVDAKLDLYNIWWALIKRNVAPALDLELLEKPGYELRVETRIRSSHAPRRVNLHFNTQRTTDFHTHLKEYDIADTNRWHTISMTTEDFDARPGDTINAQMALIDWGLEQYEVDVDYFKVDVVKASEAGPDKGNPLSYHPPIPDPETFTETIPVSEDGMVDLHYPDMNFNRWQVSDEEPIPAIAAGGTQSVILKWNLEEFSGRQVDGSGLLEVATYSLEQMETDLEEFGKVRVAEILDDDPDWKEETVTFASLANGKPIEKVFNPQMIIDVDINPEKGATTLITITEPALQRLLNGETIGIALRPLGPVDATFYASEYASGKYAARLYFNLK